MAYHDEKGLTMRQGKITGFGFVARMLAAMACVMACMTGTLCVTGCSMSDSPTEPTVTISTDTDVAARLLPGLEGIEAVEMEQHKYGGTESPWELPGPTDYRYMGYVTISAATADEYAQSYDFSDAMAQPDVPFATMKKRDGHWTYSYEFCKAVIKDGLVGDIWLDGSKRTIMFSIGSM